MSVGAIPCTRAHDQHQWLGETGHMKGTHIYLGSDGLDDDQRRMPQHEEYEHEELRDGEQPARLHHAPYEGAEELLHGLHAPHRGRHAAKAIDDQRGHERVYRQRQHAEGHVVRQVARGDEWGAEFGRREARRAVHGADCASVERGRKTRNCELRNWRKVTHRMRRKP